MRVALLTENCRHATRQLRGMYTIALWVKLYTAHIVASAIAHEEQNSTYLISYYAVVLVRWDGGGRFLGLFSA